VRTARSGLAIYLAAMALVAAVYAVLAAGLDHFFQLPAGGLAEARWALILLGLAVCLGFPLRLAEAMLISLEQMHLLGLAESLAALARLAAIWGLLAAGAGLVPVAAAHAGITLAGLSVVAVWAWRRFPVAGCWRPGWRSREGRRLLSFGQKTMLRTLGSSLHLQGPLFAAGGVASPAVVTQLSVGKRLVDYQVQFLSLALPAGPRFAALNAAGGAGPLRSFFLRSSLYVCLLTLLVGGGVLLLGGPFIRLWLGGGFEESIRLLHLLVLPWCLALMIRPCEIYLQAVGRHLISGVLLVVEGGLAVALCAWALERWGLAAAGLALGLNLCLYRPWVLSLYTCRRLGLSWARYWLSGPLRAAAAVAPAAAGLAAWLWWRPVESWAGLAAAGALYGLAGAACGYWLGLGAGERAFWRAKLRGGD
jgi:O-antigen/teichoic acid export membrane protein